MEKNKDKPDVKDNIKNPSSGRVIVGGVANMAPLPAPINLDAAHGRKNWW